jgi:hypothetical protein
VSNAWGTEARIARAGALAVLVAVVCAVAPATASAGQQPSGRQAAIGISASLRFLEGPDLRDAVDRLHDAGIRYSREDLKWDEVEERPGRYDWSDWDRMVRASARGGVRIMAVPGGSPAWATGRKGLPPVSAEAIERFAALVRAAVARYGTSGRFWDANPSVPKVPITMWDIWNEPYYPTGWDGTVDPIAYATLFRRVVEVARGADPSARFMLEADTGSATGDWPEPPFLGAMLDAYPDRRRARASGSPSSAGRPRRSTTVGSLRRPRRATSPRHSACCAAGASSTASFSTT